ncbi:MAG: hypothetical protein ACREX8_14725 [Gammaproteobacteria bacterium]
MISRSAPASIDFGLGSTATISAARPTARRNAGRSGSKCVITMAIVSADAGYRVVIFLKKASTRETSKSSRTVTPSPPGAGR